MATLVLDFIERLLRISVLFALFILLIRILELLS